MLSRDSGDDDVDEVLSVPQVTAVDVSANVSPRCLLPLPLYYPANAVVRQGTDPHFDWTPFRTYPFCFEPARHAEDILKFNFANFNCFTICYKFTHPTFGLWNISFRTKNHSKCTITRKTFPSPEDGMILSLTTETKVFPHHWGGRTMGPYPRHIALILVLLYNFTTLEHGDTALFLGYVQTKVPSSISAIKAISLSTHPCEVFRAVRDTRAVERMVHKPIAHIVLLCLREIFLQCRLLIDRQLTLDAYECKR
uniref:Uncharacterized protein n=1 Tax=Anopheles minimus TaxID=112268 RepID=A0A182WPY1_9DIPT